MRIWLLLFFIILLAPIKNTSAQLIPAVGGGEISITLNPQYPSPGETVTATIDDYSTSNTGSNITWFIDGLSVLKINNVRTISFIAPVVGESMSLTARVTGNNEQSLEAKRVINPLYLDLIIEPQTYTPAFYQGRALPTQGSVVNINAILQDKSGMVDPTKYSYNWSLNGKSVYGGARVGGNWAQITVPKGSASTVIISITDSLGVLVARKLVSVPAVPLKLKFYELSALLGQSKKAISNELILVGNSTSIKAAPYYLDVRAANDNLFTEWSIDNRAVQTENDDPFEINLTRGVAGTASVGFKITNLASLIQNDEARFQIKF